MRLCAGGRQLPRPVRDAPLLQAGLRGHEAQQQPRQGAAEDRPGRLSPQVGRRAGHIQ